MPPIVTSVSGRGPYEVFRLPGVDGIDPQSICHFSLTCNPPYNESPMLKKSFAVIDRILTFFEK